MLTAKMLKGIVVAINETRLPVKMIARVQGITYQTFRNWMNQGEEYKQQIEEGKLKKGDLTTKQKREMELYEKCSVERSGKVKSYLDRIHEFAEKHEDIRAYQWLLKLEDPIFRNIDGQVAETETINNSNDVLVVNIAPCGTETSSMLLSEFMRGLDKDAEENEGDREESEDSNGA